MYNITYKEAEFVVAVAGKQDGRGKGQNCETRKKLYERSMDVAPLTCEEMFVDARELDVRLCRARHDEAVDEPLRDRLGHRIP